MHHQKKQIHNYKFFFQSLRSCRASNRPFPLISESERAGCWKRGFRVFSRRWRRSCRLGGFLWLHTSNRVLKTPTPEFPLDWPPSLACGWCYWGWPFFRSVSECFCWLWGFGRKAAGWGPDCSWRAGLAEMEIWEQRRRARGRLTSWAQARMLQTGSWGRPPGCCGRAPTRPWSWLGPRGTFRIRRLRAWTGWLSGDHLWRPPPALGFPSPRRAAGSVQPSEAHDIRWWSPRARFSTGGTVLPWKNTAIWAVSQRPPPPPLPCLVLLVWLESTQRWR